MFYAIPHADGIVATRELAQPRGLPDRRRTPFSLLPNLLVPTLREPVQAHLPNLRLLPKLRGLLLSRRSPARSQFANKSAPNAVTEYASNSLRIGAIEVRPCSPLEPVSPDSSQCSPAHSFCSRSLHATPSRRQLRKTSSSGSTPISPIIPNASSPTRQASPTRPLTRR